MKITSTEFQQNVGRYQDAALSEPVIITKNGRTKNVLISAAAFEVLVRGRVAQRMEDLDDESLKALAAAEAPAHFAYLDNIDLG
jgi:prevent-host-death family protein